MAKQAYTRIYDLDYYSGSQCFLYIGDIWVDEITSLQYNCEQHKVPLYGYASQLFEGVAAGRVLVSGSFTINFKEAGYLWACLRRYKQIEIAQTTGALGYLGKEDASKRIREADAELLRSGGSTKKPVEGKNGTKVDRRSIERVVQGSVTIQEKYDFYNYLAGYSTFDVDSPKDKAFEDIAEAFEDQVWNEDSNTFLNNELRRPDDNRFDNFDMYVMFGNFANPQANHTVQKIIGVHLTSHAKLIKIDGEPIQEEYQFIAQSVA